VQRGNWRKLGTRNSCDRNEPRYGTKTAEIITKLHAGARRILEHLHIECVSMKPMILPRIKICCIQDADEAWIAINAGASALGLVSAMPSGPGVIPEERIPEIARVIPPPIATFLLTCLQDPYAILAQHRRCGTSTIQLCDRIAIDDYRVLRTELTGIRLVQVIHVSGEESVEEARGVAPYVDALLLDSGNQSLALKELGGTGRVHNWAFSRAIRESVDVPVFLAGGLKPENVQEAIHHVSPFGVDVCNGVRTNGRLDPDKLAQFVERARTICS
jgi:phosphoribosylanthranilate isomerase